MAVSGVLQTYNAVGRIEDVSAIIDMIAYEDTIILSTFPRETVTDSIKKWDDFALTTPNKNNAMIEGAAFSNASNIVRVERTNYTQIFEKVIEVSRSQQKRRSYGVSDETAWQVEQKLKEIARDAEEAFWQQTVSAGSSVAARKLGGLETTITSNATDESGASLTEAMVREDLLKAAWDDGARGQFTLYTNSFNKLKVDGFTGATGTSVNVQGKSSGIELVYNVTVYHTAFGEMKCMLTPYVTASKAILLNDGKVFVGVFDPWQKEQLAKTADSTEMSVVGEYTLMARSETFHAILTNLATA